MSINPSNPQLIAPALEVLNYFESIYQQQTLLGINLNFQSTLSYDYTGKRGAIWERDANDFTSWGEYPGNDLSEDWINDYQNYGMLIALQWHWFFDGEHTFVRNREEQVDISQLITPGTSEYEQMMLELSEVADKLEEFNEAGVPILWRPFHEIDGGWCWWTDTENPENTAQLWRIMYDYFTNERQLNNLIWVYNASDQHKDDPEYKKRFYPGDNYVDIASIDIYSYIDPKTATDEYWEYWDLMEEIAPNKMLALAEVRLEAPNPDYMEQGDSPPWLYNIPWFSTLDDEWLNYVQNHDVYITLDEYDVVTFNTAPEVGIKSPSFDGTNNWFGSNDPVLEAYVTDRDGESDLEKVEFLANGEVIATLEEGPFSFTWENAPPGIYEISVRAFDKNGHVSLSTDMGETYEWNNYGIIATGVEDLARNKVGYASSNLDVVEQAFDGDYLTAWEADPEIAQGWVYVDLENIHEIENVILRWDLIYPKVFSIDVATNNPEEEGSWTRVYTEDNFTGDTLLHSITTMDIGFEPVEARYVRVNMTEKRTDRQANLHGYSINAFEVPIFLENNLTEGDSLLGSNSDDTLTGGKGDDTLDGGENNDYLFGGKGDDLIIGGLGRDTLKGVRGKDSLDGGAGDDTLNGGENNDYLFGGKGDDLIIGDLGRDTLKGGRGQDSFLFDNLAEGVDKILDFNPDEDLLLFSASGFQDGLEEGEIRQEQFLIVSNIADVSDSFSLGFIYAEEEKRLSYIDRENNIDLTPLAIFPNQPNLEINNFQVI